MIFYFQKLSFMNNSFFIAFFFFFFFLSGFSLMTPFKNSATFSRPSSLRVRSVSSAVIYIVFIVFMKTIRRDYNPLVGISRVHRNCPVLYGEAKLLWRSFFRHYPDGGGWFCGIPTLPFGCRRLGVNENDDNSLWIFFAPPDFEVGVPLWTLCRLLVEHLRFCRFLWVCFSFLHFLDILFYFLLAIRLVSPFDCG